MRKTENVPGIAGSKESIQAVIDGVQKLTDLTKSRLSRDLKVFSKKAISDLSLASEDRLIAMREQISVMEKILQGSSPALANEKVHPEWSLVARALELYGLHLKDDFQSVLKSDDVIEVYNSTHHQLFRTFNFYHYSSYSYLDLLSYEWFRLWQRSNSSIEALLLAADQVLTGQRTGNFSLMDIPAHVLKEVHNPEDLEDFQARTVLGQFCYLTPLYNSAEEIGGFIINSQCKNIGSGSETDNLGFI